MIWHRSLPGWPQDHACWQATAWAASWSSCWLPDPGLAAHDQHGAATPARLIHHPIHHRPLPVAIQQPGSTTTSGLAHCCADPAAQLATAADVISVGHWDEDNRWPDVARSG